MRPSALPDSQGRRALLAGAAIAAVMNTATLAQQPRFDERVDVARLMIDARVIDDGGNPVLGLIPADFQVKIDGRPVRVETATWVGDRTVERRIAPLARPATPEANAAIGAGRLIVFLFQKDLEPSRIVGLMRMLVRSRNLLEDLTPDDRVAVLSFDSHLEIWSDFTNDRDHLERVLAHGLLFERPPTLTTSPGASLLKTLDSGIGRKTYSMEHALQLIAAALEPLPGSKSLVLVGHGFGRFGRSGVAMENDYDPARRALVRSRTSVFSLDVTDADYHSLEAGLQLIAEETGGFYARTHLFPALALRRLSGALAGYYVLFVEKPTNRPGTHAIELSLLHNHGNVLAALSYSDGTP